LDGCTIPEHLSLDQLFVILAALFVAGVKAYERFLEEAPKSAPRTRRRRANNREGPQEL
jgi:hypothetical protein